jgi:hypothetical protein
MGADSPHTFFLGLNVSLLIIFTGIYLCFIAIFVSDHYHKNRQSDGLFLFSDYQEGASCQST